MSNKTETERPEATGPAYTKEQILHCKRYQARRDALGFLLDDGKSYTDAQIWVILADYMKGEVR